MSLPIQKEIAEKILKGNARFIDGGPNTFPCWVIEFEGFEIWLYADKQKKDHKIFSMGKAINGF